MLKLEIHFDGGCSPNPGNGYGSYEIVAVGGDCSYKHKQQRIQFGWMTNNMAEYEALLHGLRKLRHDCESGNVKTNTGVPILRKHITVSLYSDSMLLVKQLKGRWRCKVPHIKELLVEVRALLSLVGGWEVNWNSRKLNVTRFGH